MKVLIIFFDFLNDPKKFLSKSDLNTYFKFFQFLCNFWFNTVCTFEKISDFFLNCEIFTLHKPFFWVSTSIIGFEFKTNDFLFESNNIVSRFTNFNIEIDVWSSIIELKKMKSREIWKQRCTLRWAQWNLSGFEFKFDDTLIPDFPHNIGRSLAQLNFFVAPWSC